MGHSWDKVGYTDLKSVEFFTKMGWGDKIKMIFGGERIA